jgi:hypothetical protein
LRAPRPARLTFILIAVLALGAAPVKARSAAARRAPVPAPTVEIKPMGARASGATDVMRARMRDEVTRRLRELGDRRLLTSPYGYLVDGSIDTFSVVQKPDGIEVACSVRLILSARRSGALLVMTTGQALLKDPHRAPKPATLARLELETLDGAVRAASDELTQHLETRRKS